MFFFPLQLDCDSDIFQFKFFHCSDSILSLLSEAPALKDESDGQLTAILLRLNPQRKPVQVVLLVDGDPTVDVTLVARPEQSFRIIMKDGVIYKDTLAR